MEDLTDNLVVIKKTKILKKIVESEKISDTEIFYMSDGTSFAISELEFFDEYLSQRLQKLDLSISKKYSDFLDKQMIKFKLDSSKEKKETKKIFKIFGWTITFTKLK
jgi:hypothetical protein